MTNFPKNPKPQYLKKDEYLVSQKESSVNQDVINELVEISIESRKLEEKLLKKRADNGRPTL